MSVAAQTLLDNLETAINARLTGGAVNSYSIGGRNLQYMSLKEMTEFRDRLKREIAAGTTDSAVNFASFENPT